MLIIDLSNILIANLMQNLKMLRTEELSENLLRHMILNSIRSYVLKFKSDRPVIIACDSRCTWRKEYFEHYKASRKKNRDASGLDWKSFYTFFDKVISEIQDFLPYVVMKVEGAEADDIIAVMTEYNYESSSNIFGGSDAKTVIVSNDKDMIQLQRFDNVKIFSPRNKTFIQSNDPHTDLQLHILSGDSGDGVPNVLSDDDCFVSGKRQTALREEKKVEYIRQPNSMNANTKRNYERNKRLIDLSMIPEDVKKNILDLYDINKNKPKKTQGDIVRYFMAYKLKNLTDNIGDFLS